MSQHLPIVISTWAFGMAANDAAWRVLSAGGSALDGVVAGATQCEEDPEVDSVGLGGLPDADGEVTLDACVMDHRGECGSVACLKRVVHAAQVARRVMEATPHAMLVGEAATRFAVSQGFPETNLLTPRAAEAYEKWKRTGERPALRHGAPPPSDHDTIGLLALDARGVLAGACTTSGRAFKLPGRVGDSPIIGAGLYVDAAVGGAAATGVGEEVMKVCGSFTIVENMRRGMGPEGAIADCLARVARRRAGSVETDVSFIALRADGAAAGMSLRAQTNFKYALFRPGVKELITPKSWRA
jgi:isoaspartyl peptidase/L-asparaginase-like protein (Ntn-hydrolase superfamily)